MTRKLWADLVAARGRVAAMIVALAVSLAGLGTVLGARTVLLREMTASYVGTHPAEATFELPDGVDPALVAAVRARAEVSAAAAREVITARVDGRGILLFVGDGDAPITQVRVQAGAWPPPAGTMLVERTALPVLGVSDDQVVTVTTPHGAPRPIRISGVVHDPAVAPAWQEHRGYGYLTRQTLAALGEPDVLHQLSVRFAPEPATQADAEAQAMALARWLGARGHAVHQVRVPPLRRHPHYGQMAIIQTILLVFGVLLVALSAILIATSLAALLARQVREIGVMKTLGARTWQLAVIYAAFVAVIGAVALALATPLAYLGAGAFIASAARMLNLAIDSASWDLGGPGVLVVLAVSGLIVPLAVAASPILHACRRSIRDALADHGTRQTVRVAPRWLPHAARNALRTPARLALSLGLLAAAGALTMTAFNIKRAYEHTVERMPAMWRYDVDLRLADPAPDSLVARLAAVPGVRVVEPWGDATAAWPRPEGGPDLVQTYPDQGHGRFHVFGAPPDTQLARLPLVAGRWLAAGDTDAIVVSRGRGVLGQRLALSLDGHPSTWTVVGIVDPIPLGNAFVSSRALAAIIGSPTLLRVALTPDASGSASISASVPALTQALQQIGASLAAVEPFTMLRAALDDHVVIISRAAILIAGIMGLVGLLGLAAALGISVVERTRELGIYKAIGASAGRVARLIVGEALAIAVASYLLAALLSIPATAHLTAHLGTLGFLSADLVLSPFAMLAWLAIVVAGSAAASYLPARRAARLTVREALAAV